MFQNVKLEIVALFIPNEVRNCCLICLNRFVLL